MMKYRMVRDVLQKEYSSYPNVCFSPSPLATREELVLSHDANYVDRFLTGEVTEKETKWTGFPWSLEQVNRSLSSVGGTVAAMRSLFQIEEGSEKPKSKRLIAGHLAGGTHHAFSNYGEGFCISNDIAVAANLARKEFPDKIKTILIIDCDVHQGNGTASLFPSSASPCSVFTYSIHCSDNIFSKKEQSTWDVEVSKDATDEEYLSLLKSSLLQRVFSSIQPDLVFLQMGIDISEDDKLGKLKITRNGIKERNYFLFQLLKEKQIKAVITMGGGYPKNLNSSSQEFMKIVNYHADVYRHAVEVYTA
jgi:acetoin utilization deacetylase AcuC-like enzyme